MESDEGAAWMLHMRSGRFAQAWQISDGVLKARAGTSCSHLPLHFQWLWNGAPLTGKRVLVRCYHGLGDTIQFVRYLPLLHNIAAHVSLCAQPPLLELLGYARGIDRLIPMGGDDPAVPFDEEIEIMELPHIFRSDLSNLPCAVPYLHLPQVAAIAPSTTNRLAVGVIWKAGEWDDRRSVPVSLLSALKDVPHVTLHALQRGDELRNWPRNFGPISGSDRALELARIMHRLDLIISVDSFTTHLAGALGRPSWTLLHAHADWRWMSDRDDSPWYPTMRLYRQKRAGDWNAVIQRVAADLHKLAESSGQKRRQ
jgi:hypothetical protein